jgi:hypothetical protein
VEVWGRLQALSALSAGGDWARSRVDLVAWDKGNELLQWAVQTRFLLRPVRTSVTILTELHWLKFRGNMTERWGPIHASCFAFVGCGIRISVPRQAILPSYFVFSSVRPSKFREQCTDIGQNRFLWHPFQFIIHKSNQTPNSNQQQ